MSHLEVWLLGPAPDFRPRGRKADGAIVEAIYLVEIDMHFDDTRAARIHRKQEAKSDRPLRKCNSQKGEGIFVRGSKNRLRRECPNGEVGAKPMLIAGD
ncbi:hypothetical protein CU102_03320 [Phyllobacterium brassicacearum]|uniref:Uncharacterized protein n=1 Tax=Phyllobacterium brassicacearum TaxID=314235 RepID=A0A2P7BUJ2_9HYPH|nr:hypothetical protein CU102_03320 [Phyllobacterium brassicacearum]